MNNNNLAFGIDLGTTNSCIAIMHNGRPHALEIDGKLTVPSCVEWRGGENIIVGKEAYSARGKENVANSFKRLMGTDSEITLKYEGQERKFTPIELSSYILKYLVDKVSHLYPDVKDVVISVPADFNDRQRKDTIKAGTNIGLNVLEIIAEPTAAAIAYTNEDKRPGKYLVYDLGGGTFDVSLIDLEILGGDSSDELEDLYGITIEGESKREPHYTVLRTDGDSHLGGDDLDHLLYQFIVKDAKVAPTASMKRSIISAIERSKANAVYSKELTWETELPNGEKVTSHGGYSREVEFTSATIEIYKRTKALMQNTLNEFPEIRSILTVGGSTENEILINLLKEDLKLEVNNHLPSDLGVALGAAIRANAKKNGGMQLRDVVSNSIGINANGNMLKLIKKNEQYPCSHTERLTTVHDNQEVISADIYQGENVSVAKNAYIGSIAIKGIPKKPAGEVVVSVTLTLNSLGVLSLKVLVDGNEYEKELINIKTADPEKKSEPNKFNEILKQKWVKMAKDLTTGKEQEILLDEINKSIGDSDKMREVSLKLSAIKNNKSDISKAVF